MEYISCQLMTGGMSRVVHILSIKLGRPLSCITPAKYDAKGAERWRWFILDDLLRDVTSGNSRTRGHSIDALPGSRISSGSACERIKQGCTCSPCLTCWSLSAKEGISFPKGRTAIDDVGLASESGTRSTPAQGG
jgi:hypothetical protein